MRWVKVWGSLVLVADNLSFLTDLTVENEDCRGDIGDLARTCVN